MLLADRIKSQGHFLFRHRSHLPLLLLPPLAIAFIESGAEFQSAFGKPAEEMLEVLSIALVVAGALLRVLTVGFVPRGTSGRNTNGQRAETLNTTGLYSIVRNPLYLGNFLVVFGFCLGTQVWWFALLVTLSFALYYERIIAAEEAFLTEKFGASYLEWSRRTPSFVPDIRLWERPSLPFSLRTVIRREYNGVLLVVAVIVALEVVHDLRVGAAHLFDPSSWPRDWNTYFGTLIVFCTLYLLVRYLKHNTRTLDVEGRG